MKRLVIFMILVLSLCLAGIAIAQDESPSENACYTGGALEGKCSNWDTEEEVEWAWNCGHYYASYVSGKISLDETPETCKILFDTIVVTPVSLCIFLTGSGGRGAVAGEYIWIQGFPNVAGNAELYYIGTRGTSPCDSSKPLEDDVIWMQTAAYIDYEPALDMCADADPSVPWNAAFQISDPDLTGFNWACIVEG